MKFASATCFPLVACVTLLSLMPLCQVLSRHEEANKSAQFWCWRGFRWFRGSFGGFHQSLLHVQATVSECLTCYATSTQNGAAAEACKAGDAANVPKYGHRHIQDSYSINANQNNKYAISIKCQCAEIDSMSIWLLNIDLHAARQFLVANLCTFWWTFYWQKKVVAYKKINIRYVWRCQS